MKALPIAFFSVSLLTSCGGQTGKSVDRPTADQTTETTVSQLLRQQNWSIENVVVNDTLYARPSEIDPRRDQYFTFADGTFGVNTNCNSLGGEYVLKGDSIIFSNIYITEMACDNEEVERLLSRILPDVRTVDCGNDSIIRLNTDSQAYILLKKSGKE